MNTKTFAARLQAVVHALSIHSIDETDTQAVRFILTVTEAGVTVVMAVCRYENEIVVEILYNGIPYYRHSGLTYHKQRVLEVVVNHVRNAAQLESGIERIKVIWGNYE